MENAEDILEPIFWRDEILQIMYWLRGEGLGEVIAPRDLISFLQIDEEAARSHLLKMKAEGYVSNPENANAKDLLDRFQLSDFGISEGKRLFAAEFAGLMAQGHGECNNPDCACHTLGPDACEQHLGEVHEH